MARDKPQMFRSFLSDFFVKATDPSFNRLLKLEILTSLCCKENIQTILRELQIYIKDPSPEFVCRTVRAIGRVVDADPTVANVCMEGVMHLLLCTKLPNIINECCIVLRQLLQQHMESATSAKILKQLVKLLIIENGIEEPQARSNIVWLVGEFHQPLVKVAPDILRILATGYIEESTDTKMQILNLAVKVALQFPDNERVQSLMTYILEMSRYDVDTDLRDRSRFMTALMGLAPASEDMNITFDEESLAVLADKAKGIMLAPKLPPVTLFGSVDMEGITHFTIGSLSSVVGHFAPGYEALPNWPLHQPDPSVRDALRVSEENSSSNALDTMNKADNTATTSTQKAPKANLLLDSSDDEDTFKKILEKKTSRSRSSSSSSEESAVSASSEEESESEEEASSDDNNLIPAAKFTPQSNTTAKSNSSPTKTKKSGNFLDDSDSSSDDDKVASKGKTADFLSAFTTTSSTASGAKTVGGFTRAGGMRKAQTPANSAFGSSSPMVATATTTATKTSTLASDFGLLSVSEAKPAAVTVASSSGENLMEFSPLTSMGASKVLTASGKKPVSIFDVEPDLFSTMPSPPPPSMDLLAPLPATSSFAAASPVTAPAAVPVATRTPDKAANILNVFDKVQSTGAIVQPKKLGNEPNPIMAGGNTQLAVPVVLDSLITTEPTDEFMLPRQVLNPSMGGGLHVSIAFRKNVHPTTYPTASCLYAIIRNVRDHPIRRIHVSFPNDLRKTNIPDIPQLNGQQTVYVPVEVVFTSLTSKQVKVDIRSDQGAFIGIFTIFEWDLMIPVEMSSSDFETLRGKLTGFREVTKNYSLASLNMEPSEELELTILARIRNELVLYIVQGVGLGELMFAGAIKKAANDEKVLVTVLSNEREVTVKINCEDAVFGAAYLGEVKKALSKAVSMDL